MRAFIICLLSLIVFAAAAAAAQQPLWSNLYGGYSMAMSADGNYVAAGSWENLTILSSASGNIVRNYPSIPAVSVAMSSDGSYVIAAGTDRSFYLFSSASDAPLWTYTLTEPSEITYQVAMSSDGKYIAATGGKNVYLFPRQSNVPLWNYTTEGYARYVAMSSDGSYIAAGDSAGRVYFFSRGSGTPVWLYASNPKGIKLVAVSGDGNYVLVSRIGSVQLQSSNGTLLWDFPFFRVDGAALSSAGDAVLGTSDGLYLFSPQRELIREYNISGSDIGPVAISADGNYIAVVGSSGVFLLERGSINPLWKYDTSIVSEQVAMSADGSYIFAARHDGVVYLFSREAHEGAPGQAAGETGTPAGATEGAAPQQPGTQDGSSSGDNAAPSQSSSATDGKTSANPSEPQQLPIMWLGLGAAAVIIVVAAVALKLRKPGSGQPAVYTGERNRPDM